MALSGGASGWDRGLHLCWLVLQDRLGRDPQRVWVFLGSPRGAQTSCALVPGTQDATFSLGWVSQPERAGVTAWLHWHRPQTGGLFLSLLVGPVLKPGS